MTCIKFEYFQPVLCLDLLVAQGWEWNKRTFKRVERYMLKRCWVQDVNQLGWHYKIPTALLDSYSILVKRAWHQKFCGTELQRTGPARIRHSRYFLFADRLQTLAVLMNWEIACLSVNYRSQTFPHWFLLTGLLYDLIIGLPDTQVTFKWKGTATHV